MKVKYVFKDLKPSNIAINDNFEIKVVLEIFLRPSNSTGV